MFLAHHAPALAGRIVVLEKEHYPREKYCAGGVGARADKLLSTIGVTVDVPSVHLNGVAFRAKGQTLVVREGDIGRVVRRVEFDHALAKVAMDRGISVIQGARVEHLRRLSSGFEVDSSHGTHSCRVLVGADGVASVVRRAFGFVSTRYHAQALELDTEHVDGDLPRDVILFDATHRELPGYYWDFPTLVNGEEKVCRGVYLLRSSDETPRVQIQDVLDVELKRRGLRLGDYRKKRFAERGFEPHRPTAQPGLLLVGEAAGIDPVTGEGIAQAIQYGSTAGKYLAGCFAAQDFQMDGWARAVLGDSVGRDLIVREKGVALFYGGIRPAVEEFLLQSPDFVKLGLQHFAGKPWSRWAMAKATAKALGHTARWASARVTGLGSAD